jgi:TrpR-related protein YerC/YecD
MNPKIKSPFLEELFDAILLLEDKDECYQLFEDLCTIQELKDLELRFQVAKMLNNKESYQTIMDKTSASTATISRVARSLSYGADGYKMIFSKLTKK